METVLKIQTLRGDNVPVSQSPQSHPGHPPAPQWLHLHPHPPQAARTVRHEAEGQFLPPLPDRRSCPQTQRSHCHQSLQGPRHRQSRRCSVPWRQEGRGGPAVQVPGGDMHCAWWDLVEEQREREVMQQTGQHVNKGGARRDREVKYRSLTWLILI